VDVLCTALDAAPWRRVWLDDAVSDSWTWSEVSLCLGFFRLSTLRRRDECKQAGCRSQNSSKALVLNLVRPSDRPNSSPRPLISIGGLQKSAKASLYLRDKTLWIHLRIERTESAQCGQQSRVLD
jgi:hypothetical protein